MAGLKEGSRNGRVKGGVPEWRGLKEGSRNGGG